MRIPLVEIRSLMLIGTPASGPTSSPARRARSTLAACSRASSGVGVQIALIAGSSRSIRASTDSKTSVGETSLARTRVAISVADSWQRSSVLTVSP